MADVAAEAHVSIKTVSRVVNQEGGVRSETAERVRSVIERLGFRRGDPSRIVRQGRSFTIGLVVEDLANPFYSLIGAGVEREARIRHHRLIIASAEGSPRRERTVVEGLMASRIDGLIAVPASESSGLHDIVDAATPLVHLDRPARGSIGDTVLSDNVGGVRSAVEHLVANGHRQIAFLGDDSEFWTSRQRRDAFNDVHASLGLGERARIAMGPHTADGIIEILAGWQRQPDPPTAVLTGNNRVTILTLHALRALDLRLGLVGYDDFELADLMDPPITVVHQDPVAIGQKAAQQLFARLLGDESPPETIVMPTRLIVRGSGGRQRPKRNSHEAHRGSGS